MKNNEGSAPADMDPHLIMRQNWGMRVSSPQPLVSASSAIASLTDDDLWHAVGPLDHVRLLHDGARRGWAILASREVRTKRWRPTPVALGDEAPIAGCGGHPDTYVSFHTFATRRRMLSSLQTLCACYADIDYYKLSQFAALSAEDVVDLILDHLVSRNIPVPSLILDTGQGVSLTWLIDPISAKAHDRWFAVQKRLRDELITFGHDAGAIDACRSTRIVGTINSKNNRVVRILTSSTYKRYDFEVLAERLLPFSRAEVVSLRTERRARKAKQPKPEGRRSAYTQRTLHEAVLADLRKLVHGRYAGPAPAGRRNGIILAAANALSFLTSPAGLEAAIISIGSELAGWTPSDSRACAVSVIARAKRRARSPGGREPRYRFSAAKIIENLSITKEEMRRFDLRVLRSKTIDQERDRVRKGAERRAAGRPTQIERYGELRRNRQRALDLTARGLSASQAGEQMGLSRDAVRKLVQRAREEGLTPSDVGLEQPRNSVQQGGDTRVRVNDGEPRPEAFEANPDPNQPRAAPRTTDWIQLELFGSPKPPEPWTTGGIMPLDTRGAIRRAMRATFSSHDQIAKTVGLSRSQLTNVIAGRFGTRPDVAQRLSEWATRIAAVA